VLGSTGGKAGEGEKMTQLTTLANGFLFGIGMILAAALMRAVLHMSLC
jgi:hypothetical protein